MKNFPCACFFGNQTLGIAFGSTEDTKIGKQMLGQMAQERDKAGLQQQIDENLKRVYDEALEQQVPDRFAQLLAQLREKDAKK
nr:NepR family anti-sigma factor [Fertoeibacter niger]